VISRLTASAAPRDVAHAVRDHFGYTELYIADLDALAGSSPGLATFRMLARDGFSLWVDAGIAQASEADALIAAGVTTVIAGLESIARPQVLAELLQRHTAQRVMFSLDLKGGQPWPLQPGWRSHDALSLAAEALDQGVQRMLVLDLARVGMNSGTGTEALCTEIAARFPHVDLAAGGGIHSAADLRSLQKAGVRSALIASALHDGRFDKSWLASYY
jgi:phosphoribosylformimino-5-aminoimidazole carboxamide ribotide isomerase